MRRAVVFLASAACVLGGVSQLPAVNLYCGNGGYTGAETDCLGSFAVNGDVSVKDWAAGASLPPTPVGTCGLTISSLTLPPLRPPCSRLEPWSFPSFQC